MCINNKLALEASEKGLTLIGKGRSVAYRLYKFNECGHEQEITTGKVRDNTFTCKQCLSNKHALEASKAGLTLIGKGRNAMYRLYRFNQCGHTQEIHTSKVRDNNFRCKKCLSNKLENEASKAGLTIVGSGKNRNYRLYKFNECGHTREIQTSSVRVNNFKCNTCGYGSTKQGVFYLYRWIHPTTQHSFLKFGITNRVNHYSLRVSQQARETQYIPEEIIVRYYLDELTPKLLEKLVRADLKTKVIDRELFKDGYTETIEDNDYNLNYVLSLVNEYH